MIESAIVAFHLLAAICIVVLVLMQQGKGAEAGASFGAGASATMFGSQGSASFLSKVTAVLAAIFFATSLGLGYFAKLKVHELGNLGLPDISVIEQSSALPALDNNTVSDVPVLDGANSEQLQNAENSDVPIIEYDNTGKSEESLKNISSKRSEK